MFWQISIVHFYYIPAYITTEATTKKQCNYNHV